MARDPDSLWLPLPEAGAPDGYVKTQFIVHSTGDNGRARSVRDNWFARVDVVVESTFIVGLSRSDPTLQIMDSTDNADANYTANQRGIAVEVVGDGTGPFNAWQRSELIRLGVWAGEHHPIEPRVCPSPDESGYGWHVMFGSPGPWTPVAGKICPGGQRVKQLQIDIFPSIFAGLRRAPAPIPTPRRRRMYLTRDNSNGKTYLWTDDGPRLLADQEEVDCLRGLLAAPAPARDAQGVLQGGVLTNNARFHDVIAKVFARPVQPAGTV